MITRKTERGKRKEKERMKERKKERKHIRMQYKYGLFEADT
jgi:hypothetical protein